MCSKLALALSTASQQEGYRDKFQPESSLQLHLCRVTHHVKQGSATAPQNYHQLKRKLEAVTLQWHQAFGTHAVAGREHPFLHFSFFKHSSGLELLPGSTFQLRFPCILYCLLTQKTPKGQRLQLHHLL